MQLPDRYELGKSVHMSAQVELYSAVRLTDRQEVLLKRYCGTPDKTARAQREFDLLGILAGPAVPAPVELLEDPEDPVLVLAANPGVTLEAWLDANHRSLEELLKLAIQLARVLARAHVMHHVLLDLHPANIAVDPESLQLHLLHLGDARPLGTAERARHTAGEQLLATSLSYIAPEQTGRMNRGVDSRSDLYGLGAMLYFALTGRPPFPGSDPLMLMHAHMALLPRPPLELRADLPSTLSRIVIKLLQKEPEDRYQTAVGLSRDLEECLDQLRRTGCIEDDFPLGRADAPLQPMFKKKLYGRRGEIEKLHRAHVRAAAGYPQLVLLSGSAGSGKSALVHELRRPIAQQHGYLLSGKFDLYRRDVPYSGWIALLNSFADQLLAESEQSLSHWRAELCGSLQNIAAALTELVPSLGLVLGEVPPVPPLGPRETQARLVLALQRFIQAAAREHTIVLFLDDLQWADVASCSILELLLRQGGRPRLLVIAAFRDDEVDESHPLQALLTRLAESPIDSEHIDVAPLSRDGVAHMVADALGRSPTDTVRLADIVLRKTGSIPLLIQQFVLHMHALGWIRLRESGGWTWDDLAIESAEIPEGAVAFMLTNLQRLPPDVLELLEFASCIADEFDADLLAELSGRTRASLQAPLFELAQRGLLAPSARGFRFTHDRIREAAQTLLSDDERSRLHWEAARHLIAGISPDERVSRAFEVADHLNRAHTHVPAEHRLEVIDWNEVAGRRALASGVGSAAQVYFSAARRLLSAEDWITRWPFCFELHLQSSESAFQAGCLDEALSLLEPIDLPSLDPMATARLSVKRIQVVAVRDSMEEATRCVLAALDRVGIRWPANPSLLRVLVAVSRVHWKLRRVDLEKCPEKDPEAHLCAPMIEIIDPGGSILLRSNTRLFALTVCWVLQRYLTHGYVRSPAFSLAGYASGIALIVHGPREAERLGGAALAWNERNPERYTPRVDMLVHGIIRPFVMPRRPALLPLVTVAERMAELGDPEYRYYALFLKVMFEVLGGDPLPDSKRALTALEELRARVRYRYTEPQRFLHTIRLLARNPGTSPDWAAETADQDAWLSTHTGCNEPLVRTFYLLALCVEGRHDLAFEHSQKVWERILDSYAFVHVVDHTLYRGLAAASLADANTGAVRRRYRRHLDDCLKRIRRWAKEGPDFVHMRALLEAEAARARGREQLAQRFYLDAVRRAARQEFPHHAAIAHERLARMLLGLQRRTEAARSLLAAGVLYRAWGARARAEHLDAEHRGLLRPGDMTGHFSRHPRDGQES